MGAGGNGEAYKRTASNKESGKEMKACDQCYFNFKEKTTLFKIKVWCAYYEGYLTPVATCAAQLQKQHCETSHYKEVEDLKRQRERSLSRRTKFSKSY